MVSDIPPIPGRRWLRRGPFGCTLGPATSAVLHISFWGVGRRCSLISTYVRRLRLAAELVALRQARQMSSDALARAASLPRTTVSRLENARMRPDPNDVMKILEQLKVTGDAWTSLLT